MTYTVTTASRSGVEERKVRAKSAEQAVSKATRRMTKSGRPFRVLSIAN